MCLSRCIASLYAVCNIERIRTFKVAERPLSYITLGSSTIKPGPFRNAFPNQLLIARLHLLILRRLSFIHCFTTPFRASPTPSAAPALSSKRVHLSTQGVEETGIVPVDYTPKPGF